MKAIKIYKNMVTGNLFNINNRRKKTTNGKKKETRQNSVG